MAANEFALVLVTIACFIATGEALKCYHGKGDETVEMDCSTLGSTLGNVTGDGLGKGFGKLFGAAPDFDRCMSATADGITEYSCGPSTLCDGFFLSAGTECCATDLCNSTAAAKAAVTTLTIG